MINRFVESGIAFLFMFSIILGLSMSAEAQRGEHMRWSQQGQTVDEPWDFYGPRMMGPGMMGPGMMGPGMGMMGIVDLPGLTEEQRTEMRSIQREARRQNMETMLDIMDLRDDMHEAMAADRPDPRTIRELQEAMSQKQGQLLESSVETRNRIYDLLTEEQQEQLREYQRQFFGRPHGPRWER